jgi:hypothetical protein
MRARERKNKNNAAAGDSFSISAPIQEIGEVRELKQAGASDLFCGYTDRCFERKWPAAFHIINRRGETGNFSGFEIFKEAVEEARGQGLPVYLTLNGLYRQAMYADIAGIVEKTAALNGLEGLIVADIGMVLFLKKIGYEKDIVISTGGTTFNSGTFDFWSEFGAKRIVIDRQLSAAEIKSILANRKGAAELEIFVMGSGCHFIDGYCTGFHCEEKAKILPIEKGRIQVRRLFHIDHDDFCYGLREQFKAGRFAVEGVVPRGGLAHDNLKYPAGCNLCGLYDLKEHPEIKLKVPNRSHNAGSNTADFVRKVRQTVDLLRARGLSRGEYLEKSRETFSAITGLKCTGYGCYYPLRLR